MGLLTQQGYQKRQFKKCCLIAGTSMTMGALVVDAPEKSLQMPALGGMGMGGGMG